MKDLRGRLEKLEDKVSPKKRSIVLSFQKWSFLAMHSKSEIEMLKKEDRIEEKDNEILMLVEW